MLRGTIRSGKITGPVQNYPALSMVFGEFEVFKSTESEADPIKCNSKLLEIHILVSHDKVQCDTPCGCPDATEGAPDTSANSP